MVIAVKSDQMTGGTLASRKFDCYIREYMIDLNNATCRVSAANLRTHLAPFSTSFLGIAN